MGDQAEIISKSPHRDITLTVVCDNNPYSEGLETAWGFSCLVTGTGVEKSILFDTSGNGLLLLKNMEKLEIDPNTIDIIVLSHIHTDHTGGLHSFLMSNTDVTVYLPKSFPRRFKADVKDHGAEIVEVELPLEICEIVYSTGLLGSWIKEQSLIIDTREGIVVITGCAHPGIIKMINAAKQFTKSDVLLVMGGFHLEWARQGKIEKIISTFKESNIRYVGPCHCSGDNARRLFEKHYDKYYINMGVGKIINVTDLK